MRYRKLRIAWSVGWGILCLLLIALWVRSYYWFDAARIDPIYKAYSIGGQSVAGCLVLDGVNNLTPAFPQINFRYECTRMDNLWSAMQQQQGDVLLPSRVWGGFSARIESRYFSFCVPHWCLVIMAIAVSSAPWLRWRFSVRALLIGMTVFAVLLGLAIWASK